MNHNAKLIALLLVITFLGASCIIVDKPVSASAAAADSWVERAGMITPRGGLGVVAVDGKIYAIGGATSASSGFLGTNEMYDPATDKWVSKAPMPTPRAYFAIAAYQGKIYCMGGQIGIEQEPAADYLWGPEMTNVNEVYDIATDTWSTAAPGPGGTYIEAEAIGGLIVAGGYGHSLAYNTTDDLWSSTTVMPFSSPYQLGTPTTYIQIDVDSKTVHTDVQDGHAVITSGMNAPIRAYIIGSNVNEVYDPSTGSRSNGVIMPTSRGHFGLAVVNDTIYAIGGFTTGANEQYFPLGYGNPDPSYLLEHTPPQISFQSPLNQTFTNSSVPLTFSVNKNVISVRYSLDGQQNVTITGNTTITQVPNGLHNITIYASDTYGNVGSLTVTFTIEKGQYGILDNTIVVVIIAVTVAVVCLILAKLHQRRTTYKNGFSPSSIT